jgi:DNA invertase Pin-like site-specific DNA recombinase
MDVPKAVAYYRVSSDEQREEKTIGTQKEIVRPFAAANGYQIVKEFEDEGVSGATISKRLGFQACLDFIEEGKVDFLLVCMVDRIGRFESRKDRNRVITLLEDSHTSVHSASDQGVCLFHWDSETEMNTLEEKLNAARRFNLDLSQRVHDGHQRKRGERGWSGGQLPYGIRYRKAGYYIGETRVDIRDPAKASTLGAEWKEKGFYPVDAEKAALEEILTKINDEHCTLIPLTRDLNARPDKFPKRARKYGERPRHQSRWRPQTIRSIIQNDFYFTGSIQPDKMWAAKHPKWKILPVDTKIKLFDQATIERARRELSARRNHKRPGRGDVPFTDYLLHRIARCGICGWYLGLAPEQKRRHNRVYCYYRCCNRQTGDCSLPSMSAPKLDRFVWEKFVKALADPKAMQKSIMQGDFLVGKDRKDQEALLAKAEKELPELTARLERAKDLYEMGDDTKAQYEQKRLNITRLIKTKQEEINNRTAALQRPKEVETAVREATRYVARQMGNIVSLEHLQELLQERTRDLKESGKGSKVAVAMLAHLLKQIKQQLNTLDKDLEIDGAPAEFDASVREMIWKQKRALLQQFVDFDEKKGIRVFAKDKAKVYISIKSSGHCSMQAKDGGAESKIFDPEFAGKGEDFFA